MRRAVAGFRTTRKPLMPPTGRKELQVLRVQLAAGRTFLRKELGTFISRPPLVLRCYHRRGQGLDVLLPLAVRPGLGRGWI